MTRYEKLTLGFRVVSWVLAIGLSIWIGGLLGDLITLTDNVNQVLTRIERLVELGPDAISDVGVGIRSGAAEAGEGLGEATGTIIERAREALEKK